jgi:surface antigen
LIASAFKANTAGIVGGALVGGLIGGVVGNRMDAADRREAYHVTQYSLEKNPSGTETKWHNPDSGNKGSVRPLNSYQVSNGRYCRVLLSQGYQLCITVWSPFSTIEKNHQWSMMPKCLRVNHFPFTIW